MMKQTILSILLCSLVSSTPVPSKEEQARGLLQDIIIGQIQNQINGLLGITTTKATPVLDIVGGLLGGETTTTEAPAAEKQTISNLLMLYIAYIPLLAGLVSSNKLPCCHSKMVGEVNYTLVTYMDTSEWGCKENCVYATTEGRKVCFKSGDLPVTCQESGGSYTAKGKMVDLDPSMRGYLVGSGKKVIVWSTDTTGITDEGIANKTTLEWADMLAEKGGYTVLIPDWFRGNNAPASPPNSPPNRTWVMQVTNWTRIESDWNNTVLPYLETKMTGPLSIGLIGTCWGSYPVVLLSRFNNIKCGISMHPSHSGLINLAGQSESEVLSQIVAPQLFMVEGIAVIPTDNYKAGGLADEILGDEITFEEFNDMKHGWTVGGDLSDPDVVSGVMKAKKLALQFFAKYL